MPRFAEALDRSAETIKRPPPLPEGYYIARVTKMPDPPEEMDTKAGKMEVLRIPMASVAAHEVNDPDALEAFGNPAGVPLRMDFLFSNEDNNKFESTLNRFKNFCSHIGLDTTTGTMGEWLRSMPNGQCLVLIGHRLDPNDSNNVFAEIKQTAPLP